MTNERVIVRVIVEMEMRADIDQPKTRAQAWIDGALTRDRENKQPGIIVWKTTVE